MRGRWVNGHRSRPARLRDAGEATSLLPIVVVLVMTALLVVVLLAGRILGWLPSAGPSSRARLMVLSIVAGVVMTGVVAVVAWASAGPHLWWRDGRSSEPEYVLGEERVRLVSVAIERVDGGVLGLRLAEDLTGWAATDGRTGYQVAAVTRWLVTASDRLDFEAVLVDVVEGRRALQMPSLSAREWSERWDRRSISTHLEPGLD